MVSSTKLMNFINKSVITETEIPDNFFKSKLSLTSRELLKKIFHLLHKSFESWRKQKIVIKRTEFIKGKGFNSIHEEIKNVISFNNGFNASFNVYDRIVNVFIYGNNLTNSFVKLIIRNTYMWLFIAFTNTLENCSRELNIYFYLSEKKKLLPTNKYENIGVINANSGFTTSCKLQTEIIIYRMEEWFKVFIHESFHCLGLDFSNISNTETKEKVLKLFSVNSEVNLTETYCEVWAVIINIMFSVFMNQQKNNENIIYKIEQMIKWEQLFSIFQLCKVLNHYELSYTDITNTNKGNISYKETTNVLSYYIIKTVILFNIDEFLKWCVENNKPYIFNITKTKLTEYCVFIKKHYKNKEFLEIINRLENWFKIRKDVFNEEIQTMRMTIFG